MKRFLYSTTFLSGQSLVAMGQTRWHLEEIEAPAQAPPFCQEGFINCLWLKDSPDDHRICSNIASARAKRNVPLSVNTKGLIQSFSVRN